MKPTSSSVTVRVPASTSNLGPGFDCLGLALGLYNELTVTRHAGAGEPTVEIEGEGESSLPRGRDNLIVKAALSAVADRFTDRLEFKAVNRIPLARGLGSSAAAVVSGLLAGNALAGSPLSNEQVLEYASVMEGHPDNAAPALLGGLLVSVKENKGFRSYPLQLHKDYRAVVCIPDFELATSKARAILPASVLRDAAVENVSRAILLASALERGRWEDLDAAMRDRLHQPYRAPLVPGLEDVLNAARAQGHCGAALSGAGPAVVALCRRGSHASRVGDAMRDAFFKKGIVSRSVVLMIDREGAVVS